MGHRPDHAWAIRGPMTARARLVASVIAPVLVLALWALLTAGAQPFVAPDFLPSPVETFRGLLQLFFEYGLIESIWKSVLRILTAFGLSVAVALPLGILMGAFTPVQSFFDPVFAPLRYMPITAFIPLLILWFGIYEQQKIAFLFLGTFVFLLPVVVTTIRSVPEELVQTALTLGASRWQILRTVLIPHAMPEIFDSFRVMNAIAWTYVILAEVINARVGLGYMLELARTHHKPSWMFAGLLVIAVIGLATDWLIRFLGTIFFRWREAT